MPDRAAAASHHWSMFTTREPTFHVCCAEAQRQTWLPSALLTGLPGVDGPGDYWFVDEELDRLGLAVSMRLARSDDEADSWFLRQVSAVIDDGRTERAAVGICAARRNDLFGPIRPGAAVDLNSAAIATGLHDAWISFDTLRNDGTLTRFAGHLDVRRERFRYDATVAVSDGFELEDGAGIGGTTISSARFVDGAILLVGNFPSYLCVLAGEDRVRVRVEARPFAVRRRFRWHDVQPP